MKVLFTVPIERWLEDCPTGHFYRSLTPNDLRIGAEILQVELPLLNETAGSVYALREYLTILRIDQETGLVYYKISDLKKEWILEVGVLLATEIFFRREREKPWKPFRTFGIVYLVER
ncbi:MAG: hypothetical protein Q8Q10_03055 [bacterium]|nr:hypothetical protein [bacterium]